MLKLMVFLRTTCRYLAMTNFGFFTPQMDMRNSKGQQVSPDSPEYPLMVRSYMKVGLYHYYYSETARWRIFRRQQEQKIERERLTQLDFDF